MNPIKKMFEFIHVQLFVNTIALAVEYMAVLDEIYKAESKTMMLEAPEWLKRAGTTAKSVLIPKVTVEGMKNYSRSTGFLVGDNTFEWETHTYSIDRGIEFSVDKADNMETIDSAFAFFSREFMRTQVIPEIDAYRIATLAGRTTIGTNRFQADLSATAALQAWDEAVQYMGDTEVPMSGLVAFVSPEFKKYLKQSDLIQREFQTQMGGMMINREVDMLDGMMLHQVPQNRMITGITLQTGNDAGYVKPAEARDINFMIVDPMAALADKKIDDLVIFDPMTNQDARAWKFQYRCYHDIFSPDNKIPGIYVHNKLS